MSKLRLLYALSSVVFLVVLAVSPLKDSFSEWRTYQTEYNNLVDSWPQKVVPTEVGLKQIWARKLGRIDRCVSCHVGIDNPRMSGAPQPFAAHPEIGHEFEEYGCTSCHGGQGLATEYEEAHLPTEFWDEPILPAEYTESRCLTCHQNQQLEETPSANEGRRLLTELNCAACHEIPGIKKSWTPTLNGIGSKLKTRDWLVRWLSDPQELEPGTRMPDFKLSQEEVTTLSDFLMSFKAFPNNVNLKPLPSIYNDQKDGDAFIRLGKTRFREARCISCHQIDGKGGHLAPDLVRVASKVSPQWLYNFIKNPQKLQPGVEMPVFGFNEKELAAVTAYMISEFVDWEAPEEAAEYENPRTNFYEKGLAVFNKYNCAGCHQLNSVATIINMGPALDRIGSKKLYEIDFADTDIEHTVYSFINEKIKDPRSFGQNTRMPVYALEDQNRIDLTNTLLAYREEEPPNEFITKTLPEATFNPQGKTGIIFDKYACLKCHSVNGTGGNIAPDLSIVGSQLYEDWIRDYFKVPYSLRPIMEERMPNLFIPEHEIEILVDYFNKVLISDQITLPRQTELDEQAADRGRSLFFEKYGCQSCHITESSGGYVGPPLDGAGDRLKPGWVFNWLKNPQKYKPHTLEPNSGMSDEEALDVTAFITSLKKGDK